MQVIHFAGYDIQVNTQLRQLCAWCGAELIDVDLACVAVPEGQDPRPAMWPPGSLVAVDGHMSFTVPYTEGDPLPPGTCALAAATVAELAAEADPR